MSTRRDFLGALGLPAVAPALGLRPGRALEVLDALGAPAGSPAEVARDEDFWNTVADAFAVDRSLVNFDNGGVSPSPRSVQDALRRHVEHGNEAPAHNMWRLLQPRKEAVRERLARFMGVDAEEVALVRNASEGLQTCQFGFDLRPGDEVLCTDQDYPRMRNTFAQRAAREGIVLRTFKIPTPCEEPERIVEGYRERIGERTRLILVCQVINLTGQVLPVREIVALGRERGVPVIVDGAHGFAHLDFDFAALDCDYYATSLHKWLFAPVGTGLLYVRRACIEGLWPLMAGNPGQEGDIRKFEEIGTHQVGVPLAIAEALTFHERLGPARKQARLLYLRDRWARALLRHDRVRLHTSLRPGMACGIACVQIDGVDPVQLGAHLLQRHRILTTPIVHEDFEGLRVSPSVYSTLAEVDRFVDAVEDVIRRGLPG
jgi:selenocysteine lyase/cysteine desulfurase